MGEKIVRLLDPRAGNDQVTCRTVWRVTCARFLATQDARSIQCLPKPACGAARRAAMRSGFAWPWAVFGIVLLGGQAPAHAALDGRLRDRPAAAGVRIAVMACVGALFGMMDTLD